MLVSDLSSLALELAVWGVKDPAMLSWLDPPPAPAWASARRLLTELGALDPGGAVTPTGKSMVRLPLHPRLGRLLMRAAELGFPRLGADLAALLSERDILRREPSSTAARDRDLNVGARLDILRRFRMGKDLPSKADSSALRAVDQDLDADPTPVAGMYPLARRRASRSDPPPPSAGFSGPGRQTARGRRESFYPQPGKGHEGLLPAGPRP